MIRTVTFLALVLALISGILLYMLQYEVEAREAELEELHATIHDTRENIHMLRAEWAHLTDPERIEELARAHLDVTEASPDQVVRLDTLPIWHGRTPAPAASVGPPRPRHKPPRPTSEEGR